MTDALPPLPEQRPDQALTMVRSGALLDECGHWFSPDAVRAYAEQAVAQRERCEADARRYHFWRKFYRSQFAINGDRSLRFVPSRPAVELAGPDYEAVVDAAIDAAMKP